MQYVGKNDIHDNEIYEYDVFKFKYHQESLNNEYEWIDLIGSFVYGEDLSFEIDIYNNDLYTVLRYTNNGKFKDFEIIGNIKETPDLIEKHFEGK
jgi:uncharacterized phage protein (TIGR01671 family)